MIVYREVAHAADPRSLLAARLRQARRLAGNERPTYDAVVNLLIEVGTLEAAIADAVSPEVDAEPILVARLRQASVAAGRLFLVAWRDEAGSVLRGAAGAVQAALEAVPGELPPEVLLKVPEGYAYYALFPEAYLQAALAFRRDVRPERVVCIGLRSIGTSLSAVVAATLEAAGCAVESVTLRPRGHPFDRRPSPAPSVLERWMTAGTAWFVIVDEGPGLSGSSFCGTADVIARLGVPEERIVLFPSHLPDPGSLVSSRARECWGRYRKVCIPFERVRERRAPFPASSLELSGGAWRRLLELPERDWPAVQPQHERRKYLAGGEDGRRMLHKFVGLGGHGTRAFERGQALAAGFSPPVLGLAQGFIAQAFVPGHPLRGGDADRELLGFASSYFAYLAGTFRLDEAARPEALLPMIRANVAEGLSDAWQEKLESLEALLGDLGSVPAVRLDGRVLAHEWLRTPDGYLKTDATDHHADHFYPGPADIAWDVAGFGIELGLPDEQTAALAREVGGRHLAARLWFYRLAYLAFRLGYAQLAAGTLAGSADGARMATSAERYRALLRVSVEQLDGRR